MSLVEVEPDLGQALIHLGAVPQLTLVHLHGTGVARGR